MKYEGVSDELLERIARDVRAWDKSRTPEVKVADNVAAIRTTLADIHDYNQNQAAQRERAVVAQEVLAVATVLALPADVRTRLVNSSAAWPLLGRFGLEIAEGS